ncbi:MAG: hypothetical protein QW128_08360 [Thermoprotei archaeon]
MAIYVSNLMKFSKMVQETALLVILVLISLRFYIEFQPLNISGIKFSGVSPFIFLLFLISSYVRRKAVFLGWLLGGLFFSLLLNISDVILIFFTSVFLGIFGYFYSCVSKYKIKTFTDVIRNIIGTLITLWITSGTVATLYEVKNLMTFDQAYNIFFTTGIIIILIINISTVYFYGDKIYSIFNKI